MGLVGDSLEKLILINKINKLTNILRGFVFYIFDVDHKTRQVFQKP